MRAVSVMLVSHTNAPRPAYSVNSEVHLPSSLPATGPRASAPSLGRVDRSVIEWPFPCVGDGRGLAAVAFAGKRPSRPQRLPFAPGPRAHSLWLSFPGSGSWLPPRVPCARRRAGGRSAPRSAALRSSLSVALRPRLPPPRLSLVLLPPRLPFSTFARQSRCLSESETLLTASAFYLTHRPAVVNTPSLPPACVFSSWETGEMCVLAPPSGFSALPQSRRPVSPRRLYHVPCAVS